MRLNSKRIEICGGTGTGKTTVAQRLADFLHADLLLEDYSKNPFWAKYYKNPALYFAEKDVVFLAQHTGDIKSRTHEGILVCDYAVVQDLGYAALSKSESHFAVMTELYRHLYSPLTKPSLIVYVQCDPEVQLQRIKARGRLEEEVLNIDILASLNTATERLMTIHHQNTPIYKFRSDKGLFNKFNAKIVQSALDDPAGFRIS